MEENAHSLGVVGVVGVRGPRVLGHGLVIAGPLVLVLDEAADRSAQRPACTAWRGCRSSEAGDRTRRWPAGRRRVRTRKGTGANQMCRIKNIMGTHERTRSARVEVDQHQRVQAARQRRGNPIEQGRMCLVPESCVPMRGYTMLLPRVNMLCRSCENWGL
jgi:hypothetical protein